MIKKKVPMFFQYFKTSVIKTLIEPCIRFSSFQAAEPKQYDDTFKKKKKCEATINNL